MNIPERTLHDLAWSEVLSALSSRCRTDAGKQRALKRRFLDSRQEVQDALGLVEEARWLQVEQLSLPFGAMPDAREPVPRAAKGALLEPRELMAIAQVLFALERTRDALLSREESVPGLATVARRLPELEDLARRIEGCFESDGTISDRASPALHEARDRARGLHRSIMQRLDKMLHDESFVPNLRDRYYSIRNGRYVVPVNAQHQAQVPGIVHNASQTGQTLFVEPQALLGLGNELAIADSLVLEEERRILQDLSERVGLHSNEVLVGIEACAELDEAEAAARLAADLESVSPGIEEADGALDLLDLRHPLLVLRGGEVVANEVHLEAEARCMVVSGPNAGGKTVTLTGVGLCALMLRAGMQIPVGPRSRLPLYRTVHSAVGDAQDLARGLSTFSAHVMELRRIVEEASRGSLVLIDEIAADTDPREGAAIAVAVLEELLARGAVALVTTHLEELKALAHLDRRFVNARVGFDPSKMAPTYRLFIGAAGSSSAIDIAARMGLSETIVARARALAMGSGGALAQALAATEEERRRLFVEVERAKVAAKEAEERRLVLEREREEAELRRRQEDLAHRELLQRELEKVQGELRDLLKELRSKASAEAAAQASRELGERAAAQQRELDAAKAAAMRAEAPSRPPEIRPGAWVHHAAIGRDVEILEVVGDEAVVSAGPMKMRVPVRELAAARGGKKAPKFLAGTPEEKKAKALERAEGAAAAALRAPNFRCDVRGLRADDAKREVEQFLDRLYRSGDEAALIIHGHGSGALKQTIRDYLAESPYVRVFRPGEGHEGGDGVTVVTLKT